MAELPKLNVMLKQKRYWSDCENSRIKVYLVGFAVLSGGLLRLAYSYFKKGLRFPDELRIFQYISYFSDSLGFPVNFQDMPMLTVFFGLLKRYFNLSISGLINVNILFSIVTILIIAKLANLLTEKCFSGVFASIIAAFYPFFIFYSETLLSETIFMAFLSAGFFYFLKSRPIISFLFFGFAQLTRPTIIFFIPVLICYYVIFLAKGLTKKRITRNVVFMMLVFLMCITPWMIRNYETHNLFVLTKVNGGQTL
jgi:hypothetical protein